jgi:ubiquinone/menaquinone biosynthesis C-methylase UbiE
MLKERLTAPFVHPRGLAGRFAARVMERGNAEANRWAVDLLGLSATDRFLDVGCGPGVAVRYAASLSPVLAVGVDPAPVMIDHAAAADDAGGRSSTVEFKVASAENIPYPDGTFTAAAAINSAMVWDSRHAGFAEVRRVVVDGGRVVVALRERNEQASRLSPARFAGVPSEDIAAVFHAMTDAGFVDPVRHHAAFGSERYIAVMAVASPDRTGG